MDKLDNTTPNGQTGAVAARATEQATRSVLRPWRTPSFERIPLNEALFGTNPSATPDGSDFYS